MFVYRSYDKFANKTGLRVNNDCFRLSFFLFPLFLLFASVGYMFYRTTCYNVILVEAYIHYEIDDTFICSVYSTVYIIKRLHTRDTHGGSWQADISIKSGACNNNIRIFKCDAPILIPHASPFTDITYGLIYFRLTSFIPFESLSFSIERRIPSWFMVFKDYVLKLCIW